MNSRERINAVLNFEQPDRLPIIEWAPYWDKTIERWKGEGLPSYLHDPREIREYFELDPLLDHWIFAESEDCPSPPEHGKPIISNEREYMQLLPCLYPKPSVDLQKYENYADLQQKQGAALWFWVEGFFWHPRTLLGIREHMLAFYDDPILMNNINDHHLEFVIRTIDEICDIVEPQFMALGEDMSYNHGSMISKDIFFESLAPYYRVVAEHAKKKDIKLFIDSDGLVDEPLTWYKEVGCEGFFPLERQAGVDLSTYRQLHPRFLFMGGFDKMTMHLGERAMRREFERLLPVMQSGGYIQGVDHQTPPEVSLENYKLYLSLLREYAVKAAN